MPASAGAAPGPATVASLGEHALLERLRQRIPPAPPWTAVGIGDDAAVVEPARNTLTVLTVDALVDGVHVDQTVASPTDIGYRALAVNLSDLAAMGATPRAALLSLALPDVLPVATFDALLDGFLDAAAAHQVALVGGNLTRTPGPLVLDVVAVGAVRRRRVLTRGGGRPGDALYVSGTLGAAAAGLGWLRAQRPQPEAAPDPDLERCAARYRRPTPRVRLGTLVGRNRAARAAIDLSDGLGEAVRQMAAACGTGAIIEERRLPIDPGAERWFRSQGRDPVAASLASDDYELLFAVPAKAQRRFDMVCRLAKGLAVTRIGTLTAGSEVLLERDGHQEPLPGGYDHFAP
jgi:thiamine-monophosphate kinase